MLVLLALLSCTAPAAQPNGHERVDLPAPAWNELVPGVRVDVALTVRPSPADPSTTTPVASSAEIVCGGARRRGG